MLGKTESMRTFILYFDRQFLGYSAQDDFEFLTGLVQKTKIEKTHEESNCNTTSTVKMI